MNSDQSLRFNISIGGVMALAVLIGSVGGACAQGVHPAPYHINAPLYPVTYTPAQKDAQRAAGRAIVKRINDALAAGVHSFTVPRGVYRISPAEDTGKIKIYHVHGFTLNLAHTEFILENGLCFPAPQDSSDIAVSGPVVIDTDPLQVIQGTIGAFDEGTGLMTVRVMPGYRVDIDPKGVIDTFSPDGVYLANPSWAGYTEGKVLDAAQRLIQVKTNRSKEFKGLYKVGNLFGSRLHGHTVFSPQKVHNFTVKDIELYTGLGFMWGGGDGDWNLIGVHGIPRPGTNRLYNAAGCQTGNDGGNVLMEDCQLGISADDTVDYGGGGLFMCERQETPGAIVSWGGKVSAGDKINVYSGSAFQPVTSAIVTAVTNFTDPAIQADAHHFVKNILKARDGGDRQLRRVTLDREVQISPGDYLENDTRRIDHFTIRNCYFHDAGVRVMVQGFKHGLFENNRFFHVSGGLCLTCDAWWWEGPTCQDMVVRNNVFQNTTFRNGWGTGEAAINIGPSWSEGKSDPSRPCAFHGAVISGNRIINSSRAGICVSNTDHITIENNEIVKPYTLGTPAGAIQLLGVQDAQVRNNEIVGCSGPNVWAKGSQRLDISNNRFDESFKNADNPPKDAPDAIISITECTGATIAANKIADTDAANAIWVEGSKNIHVTGNIAKRRFAPGAILVGTGSGNTGISSK